MANSKIVKQWFKFAARDLKAAKVMVPHGSQFKNEIAFHVQQCVEKSIKGFLVFHGIRPPKTHEIEKLAELAVPYDPGVLGFLSRVKRISEYAVTYRYPDSEVKPITFVRAKADLKLANKIYDRLLRSISL